MDENTPLRLYRARLREVLASVAQGQRDLESIHAEISRDIIARIRAAGDNTNASALEAQFRQAFEKTAFKRVSLTKRLIEQGARAGPKAARQTFRATYGDQVSKAQVRATKKALSEAGERIAGRVTVDGKSLSKRIRGVDAEVSAGMAREVQAGIQQRKGILGAAKQIQKIDTRDVQLPKYLQRLESAARAGNVTQVKKLSSKYLEMIKNMGEVQPDGSFKASKFSLRAPTKRFVEQVSKASEKGIDKIVGKYVQERAAWRAAVIARNESVEAYRQSYIEQSKNKPGLVAYRWTLSPGRHVHMDECDIFARANQHGLGPGVYPKDAVPRAPHPMCICSCTAVMDAKHFERDEADQGQVPEEMRDTKSPDAIGWLKQNDAAAAKILGPTRHQLLKQGVNVLDETGKPRLVRDLLPSFGRAAE